MKAEITEMAKLIRDWMITPSEDMKMPDRVFYACNRLAVLVLDGENPAPLELSEAAKELKNHAWLSRFRMADYANGYNQISPEGCRQIAGYVDGFISKVIGP